MSITVQHVPAQHPYTRAIRPLDPGAAPDVVFLPDPPVPGAPAYQWWPPRALDAEWLAEHRPDVLHVHFGFEHFSPAQLAAALDAQHAHGGAVVVTVHDLENPHLTDQGPHRDRLAVLLGRADAVLTLTPGAAATLARDYGVRALVVPHPHIVPLEDLVAPTLAEEGCVNYDLHVAEDDPATFFFYENWTDAEKLDAHLANDHLVRFAGRLDEFLVGGADGLVIARLKRIQ